MQIPDAGQRRSSLENVHAGTNHGIDTTDLVAHRQLKGRMEYRRMRIDELEKAIALKEKLGRDCTVQERALLQLLETADPILEKLYS